MGLIWFLWNQNLQYCLPSQSFNFCLFPYFYHGYSIQEKIAHNSPQTLFTIFILISSTGVSDVSDVRPYSHAHDNHTNTCCIFFVNCCSNTLLVFIHTLSISSCIFSQSNRQKFHVFNGFLHQATTLVQSLHRHPHLFSAPLPSLFPATHAFWSFSFSQEAPFATLFTLSPARARAHALDFSWFLIFLLLLITSLLKIIRSTWCTSYIYIYKHTHTRTHTHTHAHTHTRTQTRTHTHTNRYYLHTDTDTGTDTDIDTDRETDIDIDTDSMYAYTYVCIHICIYVHINIYT
jgi:hypothetical protein